MKVTKRRLSMEIKKHMKTPWLLIPTQLLIHGQWWSNRSTHLLHILQCRDLSVLTTSQSAQSRTGSKIFIISIKGTPLGLFKKPGSLHIEIK